MSVAGTVTLKTGALAAAVGGNGGAGGLGGNVIAAVEGSVATRGADARGLVAESIGGGGGSGGMSVAGTWSLGVTGSSGAASVAVGGSGGSGNKAGNVSVINAASIGTEGDRAVGLVARSVGGGGGAGGLAVAGAVTQAATGSGSTALAVSTAVGGSGGIGNVGGTVAVANQQAISTRGQDATGIFAQSVGGGGGSGGASVGLNTGLTVGGTTLAVNLALGGMGGSGNNADVVRVTNYAGIGTEGGKSNGIQAQSVGGGGGTGGSAREINLIGGFKADGQQSSVNNIQLNSAVGGNGGEASHGAAVVIDNYGSIATQGEVARGIFAQSIGGGGGSGGAGIRGIGSGTIADFLVEANKSVLAKTLNVIVGGNAGASGDGKEVAITNRGTIATAGLESHGIFAQSIGGGGGEAKNWVTGQDAATGGTATVGLMGRFGLGGAGGAAGDGGAVTIANSSNITTTGAGAKGIIAQSIGGGGGVAGNVDRALPDHLNVGTFLAMGRDGGSAGNGGAVTVTHSSRISTTGQMADGIFAQSVGGGGGLGGGVGYDALNTPLYSVTAGSVGGRGSASNVAVTVSAAEITTSGANANGIFAQSAAGTATSSQTAQAGNVSILVASSSIVAQGADAHGIFAQSVGEIYNAPSSRLGNGNITINIGGPGSSVVGGSGNGAAIRIDGGHVNTITNEGTIRAASNLAIVAGIGNDHVDNHGSIRGDVKLGAGENSFTNHAGATLTGDMIDIGAGNSFTNRGGVSISGTGSQLISGLFTQEGSGASMILRDGATFGASEAQMNGGTFGGHGTITSNVFANGSTLQVGASPDSLTLLGGFSMVGGNLLFDIGSDGAGGFLYSTFLFGDSGAFSVRDSTITLNFNGVEGWQFGELYKADTFFGLYGGGVFSSQFDYRSVFVNTNVVVRGTGYTFGGHDFWSGAVEGPPLLPTGVPDTGSTAILLAIGLIAVMMGHAWPAARRNVWLKPGR